MRICTSFRLPNLTHSAGSHSGVRQNWKEYKQNMQSNADWRAVSHDGVWCRLPNYASQKHRTRSAHRLGLVLNSYLFPFIHLGPFSYTLFFLLISQRSLFSSLARKMSLANRLGLARRSRTDRDIETSHRWKEKASAFNWASPLGLQGRKGNK